MTREQFDYLERLKRALEWFAEEENYQCVEHGNCDDRSNIPVNVLGLEIARKALKNED